MCSTSAGFLSSLFGDGGGKAPNAQSLDLPLAGFESVDTDATVKDGAAPSIESTKLENGATIVSKDVAGPNCTIGVYVDAGTVNETIANAGVTRLLEAAAFRSTTSRSHFRIVRESEAIGAYLGHTSERETMVYSVQCLKTHVAEATELLLDCTLNPKFNSWEVNETAKNLMERLDDARKNPDLLISEAMNTTAFSGGLANNVVVSNNAISRLTVDDCADFVAKNFTGPRVVLAGAGASHNELRAVAAPLMAGLSAEAGATAPASTYTGGDWRCEAEGPTHVSLGFSAGGGWSSIKRSTLFVVMQFLMGGGLSFSTGGPGKGMYSRLYMRALNRYAWLQNCTFFGQHFKDHGVVGISTTVHDPSMAPEAIAVAVTELKELAKGSTTKPELERAKKATISGIVMNMEHVHTVSEDMGRQQIAYGKHYSLEDTIKEIDSLTLKDVSAAATEMLKTPLTMASYGDLAYIPRYEEVAKQF